jgi:hypothetical protein
LNNSPASQNLDDQSEIFLIDIVYFLQSAWKKLAISAVVGTVLGLGGWFVLGSYSAECVLLNNNSYALDLVSWKMLQKSLPNLAGQIIDENKAPENQTSIYKAMANKQWWQKNIVPSFALSKADTKDLAGISKDLDGASTTILNFTLTASGSSKQQAIDNVRAASQFLRSGGAYLQLRSLLGGYETQTISAVSDVQQKITYTQIEMDYQQDRIRQLGELHKRFPGGNAPAQQVVDAKESSAKYLPLQTQIIAVNNDLNGSKEALTRLQKRLDQLALTKTFLEQSLPLQDQTFDGLKLNQQLLEIESSLRAKLSKDDSNGADFLNALQAQLLAIQVRFSKGLEANTAPTASHKGMIKATAAGFAAAFFLMLMFLLGQKAWASVKEQDAKAVQ